jgi:hypothetical protein
VRLEKSVQNEDGGMDEPIEITSRLRHSYSSGGIGRAGHIRGFKFQINALTPIMECPQSWSGAMRLSN